MADFPAMERRPLEVAANELVAAREQMLPLGRKTARERLASFLLAQSRMGVIRGAPRRRHVGHDPRRHRRSVVRDPDGPRELAEGLG
jgi:CRP-like cAMP-binding protein